MSRTIALTGATGFIGGVLARRLETIGWQIRALVRPASLGARYAGTATQWIEGDLEDLDSLRRLVNGVYAVVHCAGAVRGASQAQFDGVNVDGVARLVQASKKQHRMPRFLLISSLAAREPHLSPYAASKRQGEDTLAATAGNMNRAVLRPSAVYGPGDQELLSLFRWIGRGIAPILGSRSARFSLLYVEDLAGAVVQWLNSGTNERHAFELHDGHPDGYSWDDVVDTVARLYDRHVFRIKVPVVMLRLLAGLNLGAAQTFGYAPMLTPGKVRELRHLNWVCDNNAFSRETGWKPQFSLEEGLRRTLLTPHSSKGEI
jgi:nucleoside-diphosphate-sugar epimerase